MENMTLEASLTEPFTLEGKKDSGAVLLLHGFTGYPGEMRFVAEALNSTGLTVCVPRLPGHGTNSADFLKSRSQDWLNTARELAADMKSLYSPFFLMGVSMGGLLALLSSVESAPDGIILGAPALILKNCMINLTPFLKYFIGRIPSGESKDHGDETKNHLDREYWAWRYPSSLHELLKLQLLTRGQLNKIRCPLLIFEALKDKTVDSRSMTEIIGTVRSSMISLVRLEKSEHQVFNGCERAFLAGETLEWIRKILNGMS